MMVAMRIPLANLTKLIASAVTCCANSRVGHRINTCGSARPGTGLLFGLAAINLFNRGNKKAAVFPLPVWLLTIQSPPIKAAGITCS